MNEFPKRPDNHETFWSLDAKDCDCLVYVALFGVPNEKAFLMFHPEWAGDGESKKLSSEGKKACKNLFNFSKARDYMESYRETVQRYIEARAAEIAPTIKPKTEEVDASDDYRDRAVRKLLSDVLTAIDCNQSLDAESLKDFVDIARKIGLLKEDEEKIEAPRRYLPETCDACRYKTFVDDCIDKGLIKETK